MSLIDKLQNYDVEKPFYTFVGGLLKEPSLTVSYFRTLGKICHDRGVSAAITHEALASFYSLVSRLDGYGDIVGHLCGNLCDMIEPLKTVEKTEEILDSRAKAYARRIQERCKKRENVLLDGRPVSEVFASMIGGKR